MNDISTIQNGMTGKEWLEIIANIAAILTFLGAAGAWLYYQCGIHQKRKRLESYLKAEKAKATDKGQRSLLHLVIKVGLTESEILQASFKSRYIKRLEKKDPVTQMAEKILLEFTGSN